MKLTTNKTILAAALAAFTLAGPAPAQEKEKPGKLPVWKEDGVKAFKLWTEPGMKNWTSPEFNPRTDFAFKLEPGAAFAWAQPPLKRSPNSDRLYSNAKRSMDRRQYEEAIGLFKQVIDEGGSYVDASLYWTAYSQNKLGQRDAALATLNTLKQNHATSQWLNDAKALEVEVRQSAGQPVNPGSAEDEDIKLMALNGIMNSDPERAIPVLQKMLQGANSPKVKERALFVLAQSDSSKAREVVVQIAKGGGNPELQRMAVRGIATQGGSQAGQMLYEIYQTQASTEVKREVLRGFMICGDKTRLAMAAKSEKDPALRLEAIRQMGPAGDGKGLEELFRSETDPNIRKEILNSMMVAGSSQTILAAAREEKDPAVRVKAIQMLGVMGGNQTGEALVQLYAKETEKDLKKHVIRALFVQNNVKAMIDIARKETDPELKKEVVRQLSHTNSKEAADFMMELLNK